MAYNTGNPSGSSDPRDLSDSAADIDTWATSTTADTHPDRLGVQRLTFRGMENEFDAAQADRAQRFNLFLANSGYQFVGDYAAGIELTEYNQVVRDVSGNLWRVSASTSLPYTTTGAGLPEGGAFIAIGDADLAQNLISDPSTGQGALLVRGSVIYVDTIADLQALPTSELVDGQAVQVGATTFNYDGVNFIPAGTIYAADYGVVADNLTDNAAAFNELSDAILQHKPEKIVLPDGMVRSSMPLANTRGVNVTCEGVCRLIPISSERIYTVGGGSSLPDISGTISKDDTSITFVSEPDLVAGDVIRVMSGLSTNSTAGNDIWLYKQFLIVESISGNTVTLSEKSKYTHVTDGFQIFKTECVGGTTENIQVQATDPTFSGPYPWQVASAYQHEFVNFRCTRSASFVVASDKIIFTNSYIQGFNSGASTARGTISVHYEKCEIHTSPDAATDYSAFIEESPEKVTFDDCDFIGAISFGASADNTPPKKGIVRSSRIYSINKGARVKGWYNGDEPAVEFDDCVFYAPGATSSGGVKTIIDIAFADSAKITNCHFPGADTDAHTVSIENSGGFKLTYANNDDSGTLGPHSSVTQVRSRVFSVHKSRLESGGLALPFSATSDNPNILDHYEEGSFTPTLTTDDVDFTSVTYRNQRSGRYVKIGRLVYVQIHMETEVIDKGAASGGVCVGGLPFVAQPEGIGDLQGLSALSVAGARYWVETPSSAETVQNTALIKLMKRATSVSADINVVISDVRDTGTTKCYATISGWYLTQD